MSEMRHPSDSNPVVFLDEVAAADTRAIGAKAVALGRLRRSGFTVPGGFVVAAGAYRDADVAAAYRQLGARGGRPDVPVAVRASVIGDERAVGPPPPAETNVTGGAGVTDAVRLPGVLRRPPARTDGCDRPGDGRR